MVGKLDTRDNIEKNMVLLGLSRKLFTHSLPLIVAEQCYEKLLKDARSLVQDTKIATKREKAYAMLINLIEDYNIKLLSTKVYWESPKDREEYKKFWNKYQEISKLKETEKEEYGNTIKRVLEQCFKEEKIENSKLYVTITLTDGENIRKINKEYRNIDKATDVLSFPMFEKDELVQKIKEQSFDYEDVLGDIVISIPKVEEQAKEYGHSFERELSYMVVHGFYHLMGYDHIKEEDKKEMRPKEEKILNDLKIIRK